MEAALQNSALGWTDLIGAAGLVLAFASFLAGIGALIIALVIAADWRRIYKNTEEAKQMVERLENSDRVSIIALEKICETARALGASLDVLGVTVDMPPERKEQYTKRERVLRHDIMKNLRELSLLSGDRRIRESAGRFLAEGLGDPSTLQFLEQIKPFLGSSLRKEVSEVQDRLRGRLGFRASLWTGTEDDHQ